MCRRFLSRSPSTRDVYKRQVYVSNDMVTVEPCSMSYFRGPLEMVSGVTAGNALGRLFSGAVTGEAVAQPEYRGSGMLVLEPSFNHFLLLQLDNEEIIVDKGMFYCCLLYTSPQVCPWVR